MPNSLRHLWLLGLSGSGKSTVGPLLAKALHLPCADTDSLIALEAGKSIPEIFQAEGEEGFRKREDRALARVAAGPSSVISCGAGVVLREANRKCLASTGLRVYLKSDPATLSQRLHSAKDRPLLQGACAETALFRQLADRSPWYEESEIQIDVSRLDPAAVVAAIRRQLPAPWSR